MDLDLDKPAPQEPKALSVTQLLRKMKNLLEVQVGELWVEGEVSNVRRQPSGHWYFSLKDDGAQISCAMFGARKRPGAEFLEDGAKVRVFAEASVYEARGQLQIIVAKVKAMGAGELQARFEALKAKLQTEGLFDSDRKQAIPRYPKAIGLVTSGAGAALQDILNVLGRRAPWVQPVLMPVRVQGKGAEREIAAAIERMGSPEKYGLPKCDVLIVGRGGGSLEDLWNFNEEVVARAIAACPIPVISAVGHEIDFTIADFVADLRAPTPSAAAELAVVDGGEISKQIEQQGSRMKRQLKQRIERCELRLGAVRRGRMRDGERLLFEPSMRLDGARSALRQELRGAFQVLEAHIKELSLMLRAQHPTEVIARRQQKLDECGSALKRLSADKIRRHAETLKRAQGLLRTLGPESAFQRGFSISMKPDGGVIRSVSELSPGEEMISKFADGEIKSRVED